jgi:hypothetical protein
MSVTVSPEFFTIMNNSTPPSTMDSEAMTHMVTWSQSFYTFGIINTGFHILAFLCCAWLWIPAVRNTCAVEERHAALIVLIPLLLYLAVSFGPALVTSDYSL